MKKVQRNEVANILRWRGSDSCKLGFGSNDNCPEMSQKYMTLSVAWKAFKQGIANSEQQALCYEIHKGLIKGLVADGEYPAIIRGARVESLVKPDRRITLRDPMSISEAIEYIAKMDGKTAESVRKQWNRWQKAESSAREEWMEQFMSTKVCDFT
ncbi:hypothetical protein [Veronia pacifica]|uniref:Uncharacterized protein n=1 Tax=Veronia pacifica TaxID=1080227 RepID=A0A1C3E6N6_9GAMM|nr:hypothetical protein [Veronia pacifica]ODA28873.1 hypothetical protein A8L45_22925 [Veronia pacifica]